MKRTMWTGVAVTLALGLALWRSIGAREDRRATMSKVSIQAMATTIDVSAPNEDVAEAADVVRGVFTSVDARMSEWKESSPLSEVNRSAGRAPVPVPGDLRALLARSIQIAERTEGAFDPTWAALWGLWDFRAAQPEIPSEANIAERVALVNYRELTVNDDEGTVALSRPGMKVGLGGIAKGYALDRATDELRARGIRTFMIQSGGQVMVGDPRPDRPWRLGVRDPRGDAGTLFAAVELDNTSLSTSGDYESYFVRDGQRYHHILDPETGWPSRGGLCSVTVVSPDATLADALSTAMMVMGPERSLQLAEATPDVEVVLVGPGEELRVSTGLQARLQILHRPLCADAAN
jgi:thiamine biosynthesis lipoprotein